MTYTLSHVGMGDLRVCRDLPNGEYEDTTVPAPCWRIHRTGEQPSERTSIADVFEVAPGQYEVWRDGDMREAHSPYAALLMVAHDDHVATN